MIQVNPNISLEQKKYRFEKVCRGCEYESHYIQYYQNGSRSEDNAIKSLSNAVRLARKDCKK